MHEVINRSIEGFLRDTYGEKLWGAVLRSVGLTDEGIDPLYAASEDQTRRLLRSAGKSLEKTVDALMEDLGIYLVSHPNSQRLRRLLRFSGETFEDFLHSLDDLPDRARLAVGDLHLPVLELVETGTGRYVLRICGRLPEFGPVMLGGLRAMADDYGALVLLDTAETVSCEASSDDTGFCTEIEISLLDRAFGEDKGFSLSSDGDSEIPAEEARA